MNLGSPTVTSKMEFFMTVLNVWKPLISDTKIPVSDVTGILDILLVYSLNLTKVIERRSVKKVLKCIEISSNLRVKSWKKNCGGGIRKVVDLKYAALLKKDSATGTFFQGVGLLATKTYYSWTLFRNTCFKAQVSLATCDVYKCRGS